MCSCYGFSARGQHLVDFFFPFFAFVVVFADSQLPSDATKEKCTFRLYLTESSSTMEPGAIQQLIFTCVKDGMTTRIGAGEQ